LKPRSRNPTFKTKRSYQMGARAEATAETGRRILRETLEAYREGFYDEVSLEDIAERAGVTVQTILRRFGSKEELISAAAKAARKSLRSQRDNAPVDDVAGAVGLLVNTYEEHGDRVLRLLAQEDRVAAFRLVTNAGREYHYEWVERVFASLLTRRAGSARERLLGQLIAITDLYFWKVLRHDLGLSREQTTLAISEAIAGLDAKLIESS
jgi:AcrR family transcriptional regulator